MQSTPPPSTERAGDWKNHIFFFWLGVIGTPLAIIGLILSFYFYQAGLIRPLLTFSVHPLKTELQRPDYDKDLGFIYKGQPVASESVTSVQVSIWNAGTRSIRDSDVLDAFRLVLRDGGAILSARVKKSTRPICRFEILDNPEDYKVGKCQIKWRILEPGDGAVLQIIYAGTASNDLNLVGAIEGQPGGISVEQYSLNWTKTDIDNYIPISRAPPILALLLIAVVLLFIAIRSHSNTEAAKALAQEKAAAAQQLATLQKRTLPVSPILWLLFAGAVVCLLGASALIISSARHGPPFGW